MSVKSLVLLLYFNSQQRHVFSNHVFFNIVQDKVELTDDEKQIVAYLSDGEPLSPHILEKVLISYWKQDPYM